MTEPTVLCPNCRTEIKLTESLAAPLIESTKKKFEERLAQNQADISKREAALRDQQAALAKAREEVEEQVAAKVKVERAAVAAAEAKKAREAVADEINKAKQEKAAVDELLQQRDAKLAEAQKEQIAMLKKQRELDDAKRELDLTIERRVQESLTTVRDSAKKQVEEEQKLKLAEKDERIASMNRQIDELKRKAEQGSQQLQGEVLELELESLLRAKFPLDSIQPVGKGEFGGDVLHGVCNSVGQACGKILWESKRTKNWSDGWLVKLRGDARAAKADIAVLVSQALPKDVETFDQIDSVWVTSSRTLIPVAIALRHALIEVASARQAGEGQQTKMEMIYQYLTGPRFRQRIQATLEKLDDLQEDLDKERKFFTKQWAKREEQIHCAVESTLGMFGDFQGIAGKTLQEIEGVTCPAPELEAPPVKRLPDREPRHAAQDATETSLF